MARSTRHWLGLSVCAVSLMLAAVVFRLLPATAGAIDRIIVSVSLLMPLYFGGLVLLPSAPGVGKSGAQRLVLAGVGTALSGAHRAVRLLGHELSPAQEAGYLGLILLVVCALVWSWWRARYGSAVVKSELS